ncbi:MAG: hypothetical protein FWC33_03350 [Candidatus Bathyarchaeota archaeon]|nr:hypothetical protein [Candidatus Termiticorpusculum sp.]
MKPYPIPTLTGKAAEDFEEAIKNGPTKKQKERMKKAEGAYTKAKRRK